MRESGKAGVLVDQAFAAHELRHESGGSEREAGVVEEGAAIDEVGGVHILSCGWWFRLG